MLVINKNASLFQNIVSYIFCLLHSSTNVEIHFVIGYCAAGGRCLMIPSIDALEKVGESAEGTTARLKV